MDEKYLEGKAAKKQRKSGDFVSEMDFQEDDVTLQRNPLEMQGSRRCGIGG